MIVWGSPGFNAALGPEKAFDGLSSTYWEGRCNPNEIDDCTYPLTMLEWVLGRSWDAPQTVTSVSPTWFSIYHTPGSVVIECSQDPATPNADGSNLGAWATWSPGDTCRHVRLRMTAGVGTPAEGVYPPAVTEVAIVATPDGGDPPPPPSGACAPIGELAVSSIACVGDSITSGDATFTPWPEYLRVFRSPLTVVNAGVSGNTTAQMLARFGDVLATGAQAVAILGGFNDVAGGVPLATTVSNLRSMVQQGHAAGRVMILVGPVPPSQPVDVGPLRSAGRELAVELGVRFVDPWPVLSDPAAPSFMLTPYRQDGTHPSDRGGLAIARRFAAIVGWGGD